MEDIRPSTVLDLVPEASRAQMGAFLQIAGDSKNKVMGGGRNKVHKVPRRDDVPEADKPISLLGELKRLKKVEPVERADLECPTGENSKFMSDLKKTDSPGEWRRCGIISPPPLIQRRTRA